MLAFLNLLDCFNLKINCSSSLYLVPCSFQSSLEPCSADRGFTNRVECVGCWGGHWSWSATDVSFPSRWTVWTLSTTRGCVCSSAALLPSPAMHPVPVSVLGRTPSLPCMLYLRTEFQQLWKNSRSHWNV